MIIIETLPYRNRPRIEELVPTQEESLVQEEPKGFAKTIQCIEKVLADGAHLKVPRRFSKEPWKWDRNVDATLTYLLSPDYISLEHVGKIHHHTRAWTKQTRDNTMEDLWLNSSPETQPLFPFKELEINKPKIQKKKITIFSRDHVESRSSHQKNEELLRNLKNAKTDKEKQDILGQIPYSFYLESTKGDDPLLMPVKIAIVKAGYHVRRPQDPSFFYEVIKTEKIPMANIQRKTKIGSKEIVLSYHAILTEDYEERVKNAWRKREDLQKFLISPVQQVAGPEQQGIPSATLIRKKGDFRKFGGILYEFGVERGQPTKKYRIILFAIRGFPVPIYCNRGMYYYPVDREGELRTFININKRLLTKSRTFDRLQLVT